MGVGERVGAGVGERVGATTQDTRTQDTRSNHKGMQRTTSKRGGPGATTAFTKHASKARQASAEAQGHTGFRQARLEPIR